MLLVLLSLISIYNEIASEMCSRSQRSLSFTSNDLKTLTVSSETVVTGRVVEIQPMENTQILVRVFVEVDCVYKASLKKEVHERIIIEGMTTATNRKCQLSSVKEGYRYIFFLTSTSSAVLFNVNYEHMQNGAIQLRKNTDLSDVLEAAYASSFQPQGYMCYQNCVEISEWSEWGNCEAPCGKGVMKRRLQRPEGVSSQRRMFDCYHVEEEALCEVCPCSEPIVNTDEGVQLEKVIQTYLVHDGCQSTEIVTNKWCVGFCDDPYSMNVPIQSHVETQRMICNNGKVVFRNVAIIDKCGCVQQFTPGDDDAYLLDFFDL